MKSKKLKGVLYAFLPIILCSFFLVFVYGGTTFGGRYLPEKDDGYEITSYDIKINVNENGVYNITETISADLNDFSHGIVRYLPTFQSVKYYNKKGKLVKRNYSPKISNFTYLTSASSSGTALRETESSNGYKFYYMGTNSLSVGSYTYSFKYDLNTGDDRDKSLDMFYFNIIGTGWDTDIYNVSFEITFPTDVEDDFKFYVGQYGKSNENSPRVTSVVSGNKITGTCSHLEYGEAITAYKEFENGYFKYKKSHLIDILILLAILLVAGFAVVLFVKKRDKNPVVEVVEFAPPEKLTPTEVGFLNDGEVTGDDLSALIVYWASKGFVKIVDNDENHKKILVKKVKDLPSDAKEHEKILFDDLFSLGNEFSADRVNCNVNTGYKCKNSVEKDLSFAFEGKTQQLFSLLIAFVSCVVFALLTKNAIAQSWHGIKLIVAFLLGFVCVVGLSIYTTIMDYRFKHSKTKHIVLVALMFALIFAPLFVLAFLTEAFVDNFALRFLIILLPVISVIMYPQLQIYTKEGKSLLGRVRGLKTYIEVAEKDKLEMLVKDNPNLFYEVLPYAYVLGVTDVYMKKFENIPIVQPDWYESSLSDFSFFYIINLNTNIHIMSQSMRVLPVKASGGSGFHFGGGGGGFSGGGFGGGGGGRW